MSSDQYEPDPDDMFAETRMSFGEHIEDLRAHLIRAIFGFVLAVIVSFFFGHAVLDFIAAPVKVQLVAYWDRYYSKQYDNLIKDLDSGGPMSREIRPIYTTVAVQRGQLRDFMLEDFPGLKNLEKKNFAFDIMPALEALSRSLGMDPAVDWGSYTKDSFVELPARIMNPTNFIRDVTKLEKLVRPPTLTTLSVQEAFVVYFKVSLMTGFVLGSPWIFYQIWRFIAAGLYPHEKKYVNIFLPFSLGLFIAGVVMCEWFVMTRAVEALLFFNNWLGFAPDLRLNEWLGFAIFMPLVFGLSFQTPLVMLFVQRIGLLTVESFRSKRRIAWFMLMVFAAVINPSTDPISLILLWLPMGLLYELGIYLCVFLPGKPLLELGLPDTDELVEV
jgi:sec-independent protein translocase protein TatC